MGLKSLLMSLISLLFRWQFHQNPNLEMVGRGVGDQDAGVGSSQTGGEDLGIGIGIDVGIDTCIGSNIGIQVGIGVGIGIHIDTGI